MNYKIAKFEKVNYQQYKDDCIKLGIVNEVGISESYEKITIPKRATTGSAGYDFFSQFDFIVSEDSSITIPTGIRVLIEPGWVLMICPKSGLGFKYGSKLSNTLGIIDSDYSNSDNEGHILAKIKTDKTFSIDIGKSYMQGIFLPFGITIDDFVEVKRNGGFGSTSG